MTKRSISAIKSTSNSRFNDNTSGDISAGDGRNNFGDFADSFFNRIDTPELATIDVSGAAFAINCNNDRLKNFVGSAGIGGDKTISFSNVPSAFAGFFRFTLSAVHSLTWPANVVMADVNYNSGTHIWTPLDAGSYEARMTYDGTNWFVRIEGPFA